MWSVTPPLPQQPVVELAPDNSDSGTSTFPRPLCRIPTTFTDLSGVSCGAFHALLRLPDRGDWIRIRLGDRYAVRIDNAFSNDTNGLDAIAGDYSGPISDHQTYAVEDGGSVVSSGILIGADVIGRAAPTAIEAGYVLTSDGSLMYIHLSLVVAERSAHFGAGTTHLLLPVNEADAGGTLSVECSGTVNALGMGLFNAAVHHGPFTERGLYKPETTAVRRARQGTRVASLRSACLNFGSLLWRPQQNLVPATELPVVDCCGHAEFVGFGRYDQPTWYINSLAGQDETNVAYTRGIEETWSSNVSPDDAENEMLARLSVTLADGTILPGTTQPLPEIQWTATTDSNGNNEYTAFSSVTIATTGFTLTRQNVLVTVRVMEEFDNYGSTTFNGVTLRTSCYVRAGVWLLRADDVVHTSFVTKTLTDEEFADLLSGNAVTVGGGITIQGIGTA